MARNGDEGERRPGQPAGPRTESGTPAPDASATPDSGNIRGFPPERQDRYPVAGGAVEGADRRADEEEQAAAGHDPLGPGGFVEERDITGGPATALPERSPEPHHDPVDVAASVNLEGPDAGPEIDVQPAVPPLSEGVSRHRRASEQESKYRLEATLGSRWLLPLTSTLQVTRMWVRDTALALGSDDPREAWHALHAVLATLRDQLPSAEVADLASELPLAVRGIYYEGWTGRMERAESRERLLAAVEARLGRDVEVDPEAAVRAVVHVLGERVSAGEMRHVLNVLPAELKGILQPA
jgi:uncharacterized protein (DUF2267 family)